MKVVMKRRKVAIMIPQKYRCRRSMRVCVRRAGNLGLLIRFGFVLQVCEFDIDLLFLFVLFRTCGLRR